METLKLGNRWRKCCSAAHVLLAGCCNSTSFFAFMEKSGSTNVHFPSFEFFFRFWNLLSIQTQISAFKWTIQGLHEDVSFLRRSNSPNPNNPNNPNPSNPNPNLNKPNPNNASNPNPNNPCFYPGSPSVGKVGTPRPLPQPPAAFTAALPLFHPYSRSSAPLPFHLSLIIFLSLSVGSFQEFIPRKRHFRGR